MVSFDIIEMFHKTFHDTIKISLFQKMKTGNQFIDTILSTIMFTVMSYVTHLFYKYDLIHELLTVDFYDNMYSLVFKKNSITFEGKRCFCISPYSHTPVITSCFTDTFKALWEDIINNMNDNHAIYQLKELYTSLDKYNDNDCNEDEKNMYVVSQNTAFLYNKQLNIFAKVNFQTDDSNSSEKDKQTTKTDKLTLTLYSYSTSVTVIKQHVYRLREKYMKTIEKSRSYKKFIYTLTTTKYQDYKYECWSEHPFESTRTFNNMFFENQNQVIDKIQFFINNKEWYYRMGIPYSLGIGLYGPPGTGKTSFFKCLANMTGRHLIVLSLKLIKTKQQLDEFFFEDRYNKNNKPNSLGFDNKIIIIEDIDCLGEIVWKRENKLTSENSTKSSDTNGNQQLTALKLNDVLNAVISKNEEIDNTVTSSLKKTTEEDPITLDDILNLWDGLKETPGRILGISSNHYELLDPALVRPGRIDITLKLDNVSHDILRKMHLQYYNTNIDEEKLKNINVCFYSPAEIINCYVMYKDDSEAFMERLLKNEKF
jgi:ATP-dependent Zn protease